MWSIGDILGLLLIVWGLYKLIEWLISAVFGV